MEEQVAVPSPCHLPRPGTEGWHVLGTVVGSSVRLSVQAGASAAGDLVCGDRVLGVAGVQSVGPGVWDCGEGSEQLGHLDAEDVGDGERPVN
jgi:hypothetical protein